MSISNDMNDTLGEAQSDISSDISQLFENNLSEEYLVNKFSRSITEKPEISYVFTNDPDALQQYYWLRGQLYKSQWGLKHYRGQEDKYDNISHILLAKQGLQCIGGARLTLSTPHQPQILPMENENFLLQQLFAELDMHETTYGECSHVMVLEDFSEDIVFAEILRQLTRKAISQGVDYVFNVLPVPLARSYRQTMKLLGIDIKACAHIRVPALEEYEDAQMVVSIMDLTRQVKQYKSKIKASQASSLSAD